VSKPTTRTTTRIKEAARRRVEGASWAQIAGHYGYANANSAQHTLTQEHPDLWKAELELAWDTYWSEIESEALLTQRELLRPQRGDGTPRDERVRQMAAHSLLATGARRRAQRVRLEDGEGDRLDLGDLLASLGSNGKAKAVVAGTRRGNGKRNGRNGT